jgi:indole-3-acetate monooxygenase
VIEELSIADESAGWCAMIGVDGGYMTAYIDQIVAREMYSDIDSVSAIAFVPLRKAVKTRNGFIVKWPMAVRERLPTRNLADWSLRHLRS